MPAPTRTRIYLVRHCDVRNPQGVLYGFLPDFPLSDKGVRQAHALGRFFAGKPVRRLYVSPLQRAQQTAQLIVEQSPGLELVTTHDLEEAHFGKYLQGIKPVQVPWRRPLWMVHMIRPGLLPNDESVPQMADRVERTLNRLLEEFPGEGGICVSHGDPIQAFWVRADRRPSYALHRLQCAKGGMLVLDYEGKRLVKKTYVPPQAVGEEPAPSPATESSHA